LVIWRGGNHKIFVIHYKQCRHHSMTCSM
jgi:hypothetical protein